MKINTGVIDRSKPVLVAVSGGADSVALLHALATAANIKWEKINKVNSLKAHSSDTPVFNIPYEYSLEDAASLKNFVESQAGANKVKITINGAAY